MNYCKDGDKPIVKYRFNGGKERIFKSEFAPIDIESKSVPVEGSSDYKSQGYAINITAVNGSPQDYRIVDHFTRTLGVQIGSFSPDSVFLFVMQCGETSYLKRNPCDGELNKELGCLARAYNLNPGGFTLNYNVGCPNPNNTRCSLVVKHKGIIIFTDQGDCPCTFKVQCGKCEDDEIECKKPIYPGYCCVKCSEMKSGIIAAKEDLKRLNNG
ncbi:hypothetical protein IQ243_28000 [Nostocales cyanobacterium LEGE 11386]|nr:hypothetical protein [Nostocales cyanobacterium LEGE 11386]